jgi:hypothetical protein
MARGVLGIATVLVLLTGCGSDPSSFDGSGEELKGAGSSRIEWRFEQESTEWPFSSTGVGSIDYAKHRGEATFVLETSKKGKKSRMEMRAVFIGRDSYMAVPYQGKTLWQKDSDYEATGADRFAPGPGGPRPDEVLDLLVKSSKNVERVGNDEIRGVSVDHYRAHVDKSALGDEADLFEPKGLVIDAWIDGDGLLRRIRIPYAGTEGPVEVIDLYDFGVPVDVEAPAADEMVSEKEFYKLMEKECESSDGDENAWCLMLGASVTSYESSGSDEMLPTETMPRTVTDSR